MLNPKDAAASYSNRGNAYQRKGNLDRAIADYNQAITLDPKNAEAYYSRGYAYRAKGDTGRAIAYVKRGIADTEKGDNDRAIADYNQAIALDPKYSAAYNNRG